MREADTASTSRSEPSLPTNVGDVLILKTSRTFTSFAVGRVSYRGQRDFHKDGRMVTHRDNADDAMAYARGITVQRSRIFLRNLDNGEWSEIPG